MREAGWGDTNSFDDEEEFEECNMCQYAPCMCDNFAAQWEDEQEAIWDSEK